MEAGAFVDCGDGAVDYVVDICEVAHHRAVAIDGDGFSLFDELCEFVDGEVGSLAGAVDGEVTQAGQIDFVKVMVSVAEEFAGLFGGGVGRDWEINVV